MNTGDGPTEIVIRDSCREIFLDPFHLNQQDVIAICNAFDKHQNISIDHMSFSLYIKKILDYYLIAKVIISDMKSEIVEVYKVFEDIITSDQLKSYEPIKLLENFFELIGAEFNIAGTKSKFLFNMEKRIGIPKLANCDHLDTLKNFFKLTDNNDRNVHIVSSFKIEEGYGINFLCIILFYVFDPSKYSNYLENHQM
jgi:hypothetical protein